MKIADKYVPQELEGKWYDYWLAGGYFHSEPDSRPSYTIVIPPPNVTGMLHMGHMLNNTLQDVLVRRARMNGMNACWVPGTDHASIATEAKVVARLREQGIEKSSLSREEFLRHAWQWKEEHGGIILKQLRRLGASCDWERTAFTMDEVRSRSVIRVFVDLYNKGLIYRGVRMVNWDPAAQTALSDEEVVFCETHGKLYYLRYMLEEGGGYLTVATTRPETILGDVALCVNPNDPRYAGVVGRAVRVPLVGRSIPVIADDYVDTEFGTGVLKVTPAHDVNDYVIGEKYNLEVIDIFNPDGTVNRVKVSRELESQKKSKRRKLTDVQLRDKINRLRKRRDSEKAESRFWRKTYSFWDNKEKRFGRHHPYTQEVTACAKLMEDWDVLTLDGKIQPVQLEIKWGEDRSKRINWLYLWRGKESAGFA